MFHLNARRRLRWHWPTLSPLRPRDVVYIDPVPLVNWNRIISLILPSASALGTAARHHQMKSILVVCVGNICRSPMAEGLLAAALPQMQRASAGLGAWSASRRTRWLCA